MHFRPIEPSADLLCLRLQGERLSHAVGCAFAICLEKKLKREREAAQLQAQASESPGTFTRASSMRVFSIAERLQDPQALKPSRALPFSYNAKLKLIEIRFLVA